MRVCDICKQCITGKTWVNNHFEKYNSCGACIDSRAQEICVDCEQKIKKYVDSITKKEAKYE